MDAEKLLEAVTEDAASFAATMFYRDLSDMRTDVLSQDGNVILVSKGKMQGKHELWRAMYEATIRSDTLVLRAVPNPPSARGFHQLIHDEIDRSPFSKDVWGVERSTETEIEFDNGSRIKSVAVGPENGENRLRGFAPDLLIVNDFDEEGYEMDEQVKGMVLRPMYDATNADMWINMTEFECDCLVDAVLQDGVYVAEMSR